MFTAGAGCPNLVAQYQRPVTPALPAEATLADVMAVVNNNSARVQSLYSTDATISAPWFPTLKARLAFQRPQRFRLLARTSLSGPELDLGSNNELFWVWIARTQPPQTYFCRHDQFARSPLRRTFPVEPGWLIEALGIVKLDPLDEHHGPTRREDGHWEIRTAQRGPEGTLTKVTVIDSSRGWVLAQRLYDTRGVLLASAKASEHRRDPISDAVLPSQIEIEWPAQAMSLRVNLGDVQINQPDQLSDHLWTLPDYPGYQLVNLADPNMQLAPPTAASSSPSQSATSQGVPAAAMPASHAPAHPTAASASVAPAYLRARPSY